MAQTLSETDVLGNQKMILQNQTLILKNQEEIKKNQQTLDLIVKNQEKILAALRRWTCNRGLASETTCRGRSTIAGKVSTLRKMIRFADHLAPVEMSGLLLSGLGLELLEEFASWAGDEDATGDAAVPVFYPLYDAGGLATLGTVCAFRGIHFFFSICCFCNLCHRCLLTRICRGPRPGVEMKLGVIYGWVSISQTSLRATDWFLLTALILHELVAVTFDRPVRER
jgi:hypothetical protein